MQILKMPPHDKSQGSLLSVLKNLSKKTKRNQQKLVTKK